MIDYRLFVPKLIGRSDKVMQEYSVKQLADFAKISIRTLHYYDEIGLLKPLFKSEKNYRFYGENEVLRLQQILIYREFGLELMKIKAILDAPNFNLIAALETHKSKINENIERQKMLLLTISQTLEKIKRNEKMEASKLYEWPSETKQAEYINWLSEKYSGEYNALIEKSNIAFAKLNETERNKIMAKLEEIETDLVNAFKANVMPDNEALFPILDAHRNWVACMWSKPCPKSAYSGLADMYLSHPDFVGRYETLAEGFCEFLCAAMKAYAAQ